MKVVVITIKNTIINPVWILVLLIPFGIKVKEDVWTIVKNILINTIMPLKNFVLINVQLNIIPKDTIV